MSLWDPFGSQQCSSSFEYIATVLSNSCGFCGFFLAAHVSSLPPLYGLSVTSELKMRLEMCKHMFPKRSLQTIVWQSIFCTNAIVLKPDGYQKPQQTVTLTSLQDLFSRKLSCCIFKNRKMLQKISMFIQFETCHMFLYEESNVALLRQMQVQYTIHLGMVIYADHCVALLGVLHSYKVHYGLQ